MARAIQNDYFMNAMREEEKWRVNECINLVPSENVTSKQVRALMASDMMHRYTLPLMMEIEGVMFENIYRGGRILDDVTKTTERLAMDVFRSKQACVSPLSGHTAGLLTMAATTKKGDTILTISPHDHGGYDGYSQEFMPDMLGLTMKGLPYDENLWNVKSQEAAEQIRKEKPRLVMLGTPFMIWPYEMAPIADACKDAEATLAYDGSHVMGLIAGRRFQDPLVEGADILLGSTHKSLFGPQGGLILTNDDELGQKIKENTTWKTVDSIHWNRVAALGQALLEMKKYAPQYSGQVIANAKRLGKELKDRGFPVLFDDMGFTKCHQLLYDDKYIKAIFGKDVNELGKTLEKSNIIVDIVGRIGTCEITRLGMKEKDMPALAQMFVSAAEGKDMRKDVKAARNKLRIAYTLP